MILTDLINLIDCTLGWVQAVGSAKKIGWLNLDFFN
jgi:hypothetical protein